MNKIIAITHNEKTLFSQLLHMITDITQHYKVIEKDVPDQSFNVVEFLLTDGDSPFTMQLTIMFPSKDIVAEIDISYIDRIVRRILEINYTLKKGKYGVFVENTGKPLDIKVIE